MHNQKIYNKNKKYLSVEQLSVHLPARHLSALTHANVSLAANVSFVVRGRRVSKSSGNGSFSSFFTAYLYNFNSGNLSVNCL